MVLEHLRYGTYLLLPLAPPPRYSDPVALLDNRDAVFVWFSSIFYTGTPYM